MDNIKGLNLKYKGLRPIKEAVVTSGGILIDEIQPSTMESKLIPGLFFCWRNNRCRWINRRL